MHFIMNIGQALGALRAALSLSNKTALNVLSLKVEWISTIHWASSNDNYNVINTEFVEVWTHHKVCDGGGSYNGGNDELVSVDDDEAPGQVVVMLQ